MSEASLHDSRGAEELLRDMGRRQEEDFPRLEEVVADSAYAGERVAAAAKVEGCWDIRVVRRSEEQKGFVVQKVRWIARAHFRLAELLAAPRLGPLTLRLHHARARLLPHGKPPRKTARDGVKSHVIGFTDGL